VTGDIYSPSGEQMINTKFDVKKALFRYHKYGAKLQPIFAAYVGEKGKSSN
jgi:hypothetical protein